MSQHNWVNNKIQFPRLLAEIQRVGLTDGQYRELEDAMELSEFEIKELLNRATERFDEILQTQVGSLIG